MTTQTKITWRKMKLREVVEKVIDNRGKTPPLSKTGYPMIEVFQLSRSRMYPDISGAKKQKFVSEDTYKNWFRSGHPKEGDILMSTVGTIAQWDLMPNEKYCIAQNVVALRPDLSKTTPEFLRFFFNQRKFVSQVEGIVIGATQPSVRLPHFLNLEIEIPTLEIQKRIAEILSAFDDKIELNNKISRTLEQMAQEIFKEWFEDNSLANVEKKNLFDVLSVTYGYPFKSSLFNEVKNGLPAIRIRNILDGKTSTYTTEKVDEKYVVSDGDILVGMDGQFHLRMWSSGAALLNQRVVRFRPKNNEGWFFAYLALQKPIKQKELSAVGTTVAHLSDKDLKSIFFSVPEDSLKRRFDELTDTYYWQIVNLLKENQKLAALRDLLLPKLMSWEIRV